ncbi:MAG: hypothetical protein KDE25_02445 [Novosphingobium sp.]|nr:hypothetical protein [Novosphingobium sp.]
MTSSVEALTSLLATARGNRPQSMANREAEDVLNITLAVLVELAVANDRIDRLERMVADLRGEPVEELRDLRYEGEIAQQRQEATDALLTRALRIMIDPRAQS